MAMYTDATITIFFGDKTIAIDPNAVRGKTWDQVKESQPLKTYQQTVGCSQLVLLHQVHGTAGQAVTDQPLQKQLFVDEGDYLITTTPGLGIGVATADCLSIILHAELQKVVAVIHAGWRGLLGGIVQVVINRLEQEYGAQPSEINCFVGPAAGGCCYEVGIDFVEQYNGQKLVKEVLVFQDGAWKFDAKLYLKLILFEKGLTPTKIDFNYSGCTICEPLYCSYRREKKSPLRQLTVVSLK